MTKVVRFRDKGGVPAVYYPGPVPSLHYPAPVHPPTPGYTLHTSVPLYRFIRAGSAAQREEGHLWAQGLILAWVTREEESTLDRVVRVLREESSGSEGA